MSSFGFFTFPYMLREDQTEHWLTYIEHSKISIQAYYLSKIFLSSYEFYGCYHRNFLCRSFCA